MSEANTEESVQRAAEARARLSQDFTAMLKTGEEFVEEGKQAVKKSLPVVAGIGIAGLLLASVMLFARRSKPRRSSLFPVQKRSFLGDAFRSAALSLIGVLASRLAQRLPLPLPPSTDRRI